MAPIDDIEDSVTMIDHERGREVQGDKTVRDVPITSNGGINQKTTTTCQQNAGSNTKIGTIVIKVRVT